VYFNSAWAAPFEKSATGEEPFRTGNEKQRNVQMMHMTGNFFYGENSDAQWIRIPYKIPGFYLTIILPRENESFTQLKDFEANITPKTFFSLIEDSREYRVALSIPKFKDKSRFNLVEILEKLGMKLAFDWMKADFSGMIEEPKKNGYALCISDILHQAFIELDEDNAEAATITTIDTLLEELPLNLDPITEFRADHPFIYCLTDDSGVILLLGRMTDPK
jgi:serpin B